MNIRKIFFVALIAFAAAGCANMVPPTGGAKDIKPPKVLHEVPANGSVNMRGKKILISFDEFIQLKDLQKQLIISPPLKNIPEMTAKKKTLLINLPDSLFENTTYTISFGSAITDVHEGNALENYQYVFSTGGSLDSLSVKGTVTDASKLLPQKDVLVMLYDGDSDSLPYKMRPKYFSRTNQAGAFSIMHVHEGSYKIFALKDANANYLYDSREEEIAFADSQVTAGAGDSISLKLFKEQPSLTVLKTYSEMPGKFITILSRDAKDIKLVPLMNDEAHKISFREFSSGNDTIISWYENLNLDTMKMILTGVRQTPDTLTIRLFNKDSKTYKSGRTKINFEMTANASPTVPLDMNIYPEIVFSHPVKKFDFNKIIITQDSAITKPANIYFTDSIHRHLEIKMQLKESSTYKIFIPQGAFTDLFDAPSDSFSVAFRTRALTDYGTLKMHITVPPASSQYVLLMLDASDNIARKTIVKDSALINYDFMLPGTYRFKLIADENNNGKWDSGNYLAHRQPEKVIYLKDPQQVRANWDVEVNWKVPKF